MSWRARPFLVFLAVAATACIGVEIVVEFLARAIVTGDDSTRSFAESFGAAITNSVIGIVYYAVLGLICGSLAKKTSLKKAGILFALGALALGGLGFWSAYLSQRDLLNHAWTASALAYFIFFFYSIPVLVACHVIGWWMGRLKTKMSSSIGKKQ